MSAMQLRHVPWQGDGEPGEDSLRRRLESEGFEVHSWRDPADRIYGEHHHECDECLWLVRGSMRFRIGDHDYALAPGERLDLPAQLTHQAIAGPDGATYLIGQKR